eukprot:NODE_6868_length_485_cov_41.201835_g6073_i0.p1 GENE.NODE_6868_length_485_cov_41.201835_g6073_i0~~NODE_6868_length_485_cov_41.201835_g6073_i0.p1  ORF type:complete len:113 (-),score=44.75 NODE_6868_length_485_cov_41.201835_g6073_i0:145-462(-)
MGQELELVVHERDRLRQETVVLKEQIDVMGRQAEDSEVKTRQLESQNEWLEMQYKLLSRKYEELERKSRILSCTKLVFYLVIFACLGWLLLFTPVLMNLSNMKAP